jgi:uncharacterized protein (DUF885 family)
MTTPMRKRALGRATPAAAVAAAAALGLWGCSDRRAPHASPSTAADLAPPPPSDANLRLEQLVQGNLNAELAFSPVTATWLGAHAYDDRVDDLRAETQAKEVARLRQLLDRVRALDERELDDVHRVDRLLLERRAEGALFDLVELRPFERNPLVYLDLAQSAVDELVRQETIPLADRVRAITARLWKLRPLFDEARRNLRNSAAELNVRRAVEAGQSLKAFLAETLPRVVQLADAKLMDDFRAADGDAARALDDFLAWLQRDLLPRARGDFAFGRERLLEKLRLVEGVQASPELLVALGERELKEARRRYDDAAKQLVAGRPGLDAAKLLEEDHAKPDELLAQVDAQLAQLAAFMRAERPLTLPQPERPRVVEMPPALWGFAQLCQPGPLEARPREALLYVDPVDGSWPDRKKQEHLRAFNRASLVLTLLHEVAGHYVQAERDRRAPTTMQKVALAPGFLEGWAHYAERMMLSAGYLPGDLRVQLAVERSTMTRAARLVAAVRLHAFGAKIDDAVKVFTDEAYLEDYAARREAERAASDPLVLVDALGRMELEKLRDDYRAAHAEATLGAVDDALLAHGSPPVTILRRILLPGDTRSPL